MYEKKITDKDLQYGIGNYIQYFVISYEERNENIYIQQYIFNHIYIQ